MASVVADLFRQAGALNLQDSRRNGNVVTLEGDCDVMVSGDIHGSRAALTKIIAAADLTGLPRRRLILQEIVHGPPDPRSGQDRSIEPLLRAARLKIAHPRQVLFVLGNHDIAQVTGREIMKDGRGTCKEFASGVSYAYREDAPEIMEAICGFLISAPMAIRCPNGVFISHSVPSPKRMALAGVAILGRAHQESDLLRGAPVYEWVWGRGQTAEQLATLAGQIGVEFFVLGHRHISAGWERIAGRGVTISSDHEHGVIIEFCCNTPLNPDSLEEHLKPIASLPGQ